MNADDLDFCEWWKRDLENRLHFRRMDRAIRRAQTPARVYSVRRHRTARMLELAVGWAR